MKKDKKTTEESKTKDADIKNSKDDVVRNDADNSQGGVSVDVLYSKEFELYCIWKQLPPMLKAETAETLEKKYFIDDELIVKLCGIRYQKDFADFFGISEDTMTRWNLKMKSRDPLIDIKEWVKTLTKNVVMSTYRSSMSKDPKAHQDRKLMLQLGGWAEDSNLNVRGEGLFDILKREINEHRNKK